SAAGEARFRELLGAARANAPAAAGLTGDLDFGPGVMATSESGVAVSDFVASATFVNPWAASERPFDFGFAFRHTATDEHLRLIIDSGGAWTLQNGLETIDSGSGAPVRPDAGASNTLELAAQGNRGWFGLNGQFVGTLDLSGRALPGDVLAAAGFFTENAAVEGVVRFTRFTVWPLPAAPGVLDPATFVQWLGEAASGPPAAGPLQGAVEESEGSVSLSPAGVELADFAARVRWDNPEGPGPWELGVVFRDQPDGSHYRLTFDQTGRWMFGIGTAEKTASGAAPAMLLGAGHENTLDLVVSGDTAGFAINGVFVAQLDVSEITAAGDVWFASGFNAAATTPGRETQFRDLEVWPAEGLALPGAGQGEERPTPAATAPVATAAPPTPEPEPEPEIAETPAPFALPDDGDAGAGMGAMTGAGVLAVRLAEIDGSGVSGLATITEEMGEAEVSLVVRGAPPGALAVIHEGSCAALSIDPAFLLDDPDPAGRSRTGLGVPVEALAGSTLAIAVYADIATYGQPVACGEIG
ncbi:MAG: hypothetical protein ACKOWF_00770, partial [Chloroflexota bacterium]